jgi:hypothetical protein
MSPKITIRQCTGHCCVTLIYSRKRWVVTDRNGTQYRAKTYKEASRIAVEKGA